MSQSSQSYSPHTYKGPCVKTPERAFLLTQLHWKLEFYGLEANNRNKQLRSSTVQFLFLFGEGGGGRGGGAVETCNVDVTPYMAANSLRTTATYRPRP